MIIASRETPFAVTVVEVVSIAFDPDFVCVNGTVSVNDFTIITNPAGFRDLVTINVPDLSNPGIGTVVATCGSSSAIAPINIVNASAIVAAPESGSFCIDDAPPAPSITVGPYTDSALITSYTATPAMFESAGASVSVTYVVQWSATSSCGTATGSETVTQSFNVIDTETFFDDSSISAQVSAPPSLKSKINTALNKIPGVNVNLASTVLGVTGKAKYCCSEEPGTKLEKEATGSLKLSAAIKGLTVWGPPTISETLDYGFLEVDIDFEAGVKVDSDFSVTGQAGKRVNECDESECLFGSIAGGATVALKATLDLVACVETFYTDKRCIDIEVTPAEVSASFTGDVSYNKDSCDSGLDGDLDLGVIKFSSKFSVGTTSLEYNHQIYP